MPLDEFNDSVEDNGMESACEECNGTGIIDCPLEYGEPDHPDDCPACGGSGKALCPYCNEIWR